MPPIVPTNNLILLPTVHSKMDPRQEEQNLVLIVADYIRSFRWSKVLNILFQSIPVSEAEGINTEVFILNTEITTETGIDASKTDPAIDAYFDISNDFNTDKINVYKYFSFTFTASTNKVVIYVRALNAVDSSNEVFLDNVKITETE